MTAAIQATTRQLLGAYRTALFPLKDLATADPRDLNGVRASRNVGAVRDGLAAVDALERQLVLDLIAAGLAPTTVARRCGIAPATVARWLAEVTP